MANDKPKHKNAEGNQEGKSDSAEKGGDSAEKPGEEALKQYWDGLKETTTGFIKEYSQPPGTVLKDYMDGMGKYLTSDYNKNNEKLYENTYKSVEELRKNPAHWLGEHTYDIASFGHDAIGELKAIQAAKGAERLGAIEGVTNLEAGGHLPEKLPEPAKPKTAESPHSPEKTPEVSPGIGEADQIPRPVRPSKLEFKTREVDMAKLSEPEARANVALRKQGWEQAKCEQVLGSAEPASFQIRTVKEGEELYRFDSKSRLDADRTKMDVPSPYWMDREAYQGLAKEFRNEQTGAWDSAGIKDRVALPCYNKADCIVKGSVLHETQGVASKCTGATESTYYYDQNNRCMIRNRSMEGGGSQLSIDSHQVQADKSGYVWSKK